VKTLIQIRTAASAMMTVSQRRSFATGTPWLQRLPSCVAGTTAHAAPNGEQLYIEHCGACHQLEGQGGIGLPLLTAKLTDVSDDYLRRTVRMGRPGRVMPGFQRMSDAQVDAIVVYLRQRSNTEGLVFSEERIAGDLANGQVLYEEHCIKCHAADGSGEGQGTGVTMSREREFLVMPASISNPGFLASAPDEMIQRVITIGRKSADMPAFGRGKLSETEIADLVAYVRSFEQQGRAAEPADPEERPTHVYESPYDFDTTVANVKAALTGDKEWRKLLIRESNKLVCAAVLKNPRVSDGEVLAVVNNKSR
jgi:cytochrome c oxidase cbb3-type subunit 3